MKVKDLIKFLEKMPKNATVYCQYMNSISKLRDAGEVFLDKNGNLNPKGKKTVICVSPFGVHKKPIRYN